MKTAAKVHESSKHTPGPWRAVQREWGYPEVDGGPVRRLWEIADAKGTNIAGCTIYSRDEADARLIAAAPEMYVLLREAVLSDVFADAPLMLKEVVALLASVRPK